jgi:asparagine synthase (glutamine-hydrolysing)
MARDMTEGRRPVDFALWRIVNMGIWGERFGVTL